ncbi:ABC transporter permease [Microbaculum marinisediminis]|uniref:ABC transporter permease n=1 Tax=Microbaculum marinisediminis TaxID=2931392 RepID=A0AAW5QWK3_9HYPH|nr:ABC transporter permease [Microbaculum sp. A6E488]MCT8972302.1 ABC transporter permease [Microbaculum sp. A6E488]
MRSAATPLARRLPVPLRFALRELRGGLKGFYVFIACIALGVAAIASVGSVSRSLVNGISEEGQAILGGDLSFSLIHRQARADEREFLGSLGRVSEVATLRAMARSTGNDTQTLVELKAVDGAYPLFGEVAIDGVGSLHDLVAAKSGQVGLVAEAGLAERLGVQIGDPVSIGNATFTLTGLIAAEPDRLSGGLGWGPRVIISTEALEATGLIQPGSLVRWRYRVALPEPASPGDVEAAKKRAETEMAEAGWRIRDRNDAAPGLRDQIDRFTMFLTLVGLTALIVGGVGVANAVTAYLDGRRATIATLKSLGAGGALIFRSYLVEILMLAVVAMAIGLVFGALTPWFAGSALATVLPVADAVPGLYGAELVLALAYGILTALAFALWPLGRAREVPATALYREYVGRARAWPRPVYLVALAVIVLALAGLAIGLAYEPFIATIFVIGTLAAFIVLRLVGVAIMAIARRLPHSRFIALRLAVGAIHRPGAVTPSIVLSLGLGLTLLVTIALIDGNLTRQLTLSIPDKAPSFFFLDIPRADAERFVSLVDEAAPDGVTEEVPMLRGRFVALKGIPVADYPRPAEAEWVLRGDRGITYAATPPDDGSLTEGDWWPEDYDGPPLVSFAEEIAGELGLAVGDEITVNVLGRTITATIANLRTVDWTSLSINFVMVFSPNTFAGAPHMVLATVTLPDAAGADSELGLMRAVTAAFPTVTSVRVKEALDSVNSLVRRLAWAVRAASGITIAAGILVLAGALAASHRHRIHDAVVLKTLGATRRRLIGAYVIEFALLGTITAIFALAAGTLAGFVVVEQVMELDFTFLPAVAFAAIGSALVLTVGLGLVGTWRVLGRRPAAYLRDL